MRWIVPETPDSDYVRFSAHEAYRIPRPYHANWHGGSAGYWLQLGAPAPEFPALNKSQENSAPKERNNDWLIINSHPSLSAKLVKSINSDLHVMERSVEFGLLKQTIRTEGNYLNVRSMYRYSIPVDEKADGRDPTLISCQTPSAHDPKSCGHSFINKGRNIFFRHRAEDLANWQDMQKRVLELLASFEAKADARRRVHGGARRAHQERPGSDPGERDEPTGLSPITSFSSGSADPSARYCRRPCAGRRWSWPRPGIWRHRPAPADGSAAPRPRSRSA